MTSYILDTDIGGDVDDAFALVYLLKSNANIKAITTSIGNTEIKAKIARKLERLCNKKVPTIAGLSGSNDVVDKYWCGFEPEALTHEDIKEPIKKLPFPKYGPEDVLICIGPLTNIGYQIKNNPTIKNVKTVYIMGSDFKSHNLKIDPEASKLVLNEPWNIYFITKEDSKKIAFTKQELKKLKGTDLGNFLYDSAIRWLDYSKKEKSAMYDVLTVSAALNEDYVRFKKQSNNRFISCNVDPTLKDEILGVIRK